MAVRLGRNIDVSYQTGVGAFTAVQTVGCCFAAHPQIRYYSLIHVTVSMQHSS